MAWSEAARQASAEARKASAKAKKEPTAENHKAAAESHARAAEEYKVQGSGNDSSRHHESMAKQHALKAEDQAEMRAATKILPTTRRKMPPDQKGCTGRLPHRTPLKRRIELRPKRTSLTSAEATNRV